MGYVFLHLGDANIVEFLDHHSQWCVYLSEAIANPVGD